MSDQAFADLCRSVCHDNGWELLPSGVRVAWEDGRHQLVELEAIEHQGESLIRLFTTIGSVENLTPVRLTIALRINALLAHGAFAVKDDHLIMVETFLIDGVDEGQVAASIQFLAETADFYENAIFETDRH
ncbi:MAG: hypothetical protein ACE5FL_11525 [Myxococcota bacterium]